MYGDFGSNFIKVYDNNGTEINSYSEPIIPQIGSKVTDRKGNLFIVSGIIHDISGGHLNYIKVITEPLKN